MIITNDRVCIVVVLLFFCPFLIVIRKKLSQTLVAIFFFFLIRLPRRQFFIVCVVFFFPGHFGGLQCAFSFFFFFCTRTLNLKLAIYISFFMTLRMFLLLSLCERANDVVASGLQSKHISQATFYGKLRVYGLYYQRTPWNYQGYMGFIKTVRTHCAGLSQGAD